MREFSTPLDVEIPLTGSLVDDIIHNATVAPDRVAFTGRTELGWAETTARQFLDEVTAVAKGLLAAGVNDGDRVVLLSTTRYEWTLLDYAIWYAGAVTVPIYTTSFDDQLAWILDDSGATAAIVETHGRAAQVQDAGSIPARRVWSFDMGAVERLIELGTAVDDQDLEDRRRRLGPQSDATIIYTSGTTARPKGCVLTHGNFMFESTVALDQLHELFYGEEAATLLFLPLAHVFARIIQIGAVKAGVRLAHSNDMSRLLRDLQETRPTFILGVPRVFEQIFNTASQNAVADGRGRLFDLAADTAMSYSRALDVRRPGLVLRGRHAAFERLVYAKLRADLGGSLRYAISGGAPLGERLAHFYRGVGVDVLEGWGLTQTTGAMTANLPGATKIGTVGRPLQGTTIRVADDGELLVRGGQVFAGYWKDQQATATAFVDDTWLRTGDLGEIDDEGFLRITGRKAEIIVTASGKNVAPSSLEDRVRAHPLVSQCLVLGDRRPYIAALITLDPDAVLLWAEKHNRPFRLPMLAQDKDLDAEIAAAVEAANTSVSQAESIKRFAVLPNEWTEEAGELTPSLKLRRSAIQARFRTDIDALYDN